MNKRALLIIDMQKISFASKTPRFNMKGVVKRINALSKTFREVGYPVIFIQHDGSKKKECIPGTTAWELLSDLEIAPSDFIVSKTANDSFYKSNLEDILNESGVNELVVTGCATDFCVEATVQSALVNDFNISILSNGHTTGDRPHLKAEKIIAHYNWVWQNMTPTRGSLRVIAFQELMDGLKS